MPLIKEIVLASNNAGKLKELQALFEPLGLTLIPQSQLKIPEPEEDRKSTRLNSSHTDISRMPSSA